ncbi:unnamed protein product [Leptosia nina]|uniref:Transcription termination factor 2 n=1 Tax=Leptosia nina TaxID=320188 RepID=A0AAV1JEA1_9NEOP
MENSFFEFRDKTNEAEISDCEIENSVLEESFAPKKTPAKKNHTIVIPESDDSDYSLSDDELQKKTVTSYLSPKKLVLSSSEDEDLSLKTSMKSSRASDSPFIGRKNKKRIMQLDSDTDNSIVIEHNKQKKVFCLKSTPARIESKRFLKDKHNMSYDSNNSEQGGDETNVDSPNSTIDLITNDIYDSDEDKENRDSISKNFDNCKDSDNKEEKKESSHSKDSNDDSDVTEEYDVDDQTKEHTDDENNDDQMFVSRATRMSIMGVVPKDNESDDSDYIESEDSRRPSSGSNAELPYTGIKSGETSKQLDDSNTSRLTCSPFSSPVRDNEVDDQAVVDLTQLINADDLKSKIQSKLKGELKPKVMEDQEVTIVETKQEVITLSSDSEDDDLKIEKSPTIKRSPKKNESSEKTRLDSDIKQYLVPNSYPNLVVYVKKHVRDNELNKLNGLREDLQNVRYLLETMDLDMLPDRGSKLIERLSTLEEEVRRQGDKVANMVVEPDEPPPKPIKEELNKDVSWDDIQKASNAVQPRMFGNQALSTHMAQRNMILERLRDLYESLASRPSENKLAPQPRSLASEMMPHQLHALAWLQWRETQSPCGGILADDMGLGKTITMISLIAADKEKGIDSDDDGEEGSSRLVRGGTLVVCPASLMQQWAGEVKKHCVSHALTVYLHHGTQRATQAHRLANNDLVLTTYNILQRENEKNGVLTRILWGRVILDEAHAVRNHKSLTSVAVTALKGRRRWALTGTPLHNKDLDLFALLKFLRCSPFDDLAMWKKWIDTKSMGGQERLSMIMRCIMLRRTKRLLQERGQLKCLPDRETHQCDVTLSKEEMNVYQKVLVFSKTLFAQFLHQRAEKDEDSGGHYVAPQKDTAYAKMHKKMVALHGTKPVKSHEILVLLLRLRQLCCHCGLIAAMLSDEDTDVLQEDPAGQDLLAELNKLSLDESSRKKNLGDISRNDDDDDEPGESATVAEALRSSLSLSNPVFKLDKRSSKIQAVMDCLNEHVLSNPDEKAVVVSQWTSVLSLVERELKAAKVECVTLSGSVPVQKRPPLIDALNNPKSKVRIMLLSLCAGGVGLNLCGANHLLLLDPHWNPQLEEQAQDRIYRVGQTRNVHIYRFMCLDTVEQWIRKIQENKLERADSVLTGARHTNASKLTIEDLKMLFNMDSKQD